MFVPLSSFKCSLVENSYHSKFLDQLGNYGFGYECPGCSLYGISTAIESGSYFCEKCNKRRCWLCGVAVKTELESFHHWFSEHLNSDEPLELSQFDTREEILQKNPTLYKVITVTGQLFFLRIEKTKLISDLKDAIQKACSLPSNFQRLIWYGKSLEDGRSISSYNIENSHQFNLVKRLTDFTEKQIRVVSNVKTNSSDFSTFRLELRNQNLKKELVASQIESLTKIPSHDQIWVVEGIRVDQMDFQLVTEMLISVKCYWLFVFTKLQWGQVDSEYGLSLELSNFYQLNEFSDLQIREFKAHSQIIFARTRINPKILKQILEKESFTNKEIKLFLKWIYGGTSPDKNPKVIQIWEKVQMEKSQNEKEVKNQSNKIEKKNQEKIDNKDIHNQNKQKYRLRTVKEDFEWLYKQNSTKDFSIIPQNNENNQDQTKSILVHSVVLLIRSGLFRELFRNVKNLKNSVPDYSMISDHSLEILIRFFYLNTCEFTADEDPRLFFEESENIVEYYQLSEGSQFQFFRNKIKKQLN
ncbi:UBIQUITIN-60S ribosomal protein L40 [Anaeramoeba flamelloides]|uniref:UBIQUITIN-60S ribosomal protein L40 n=1 Tax=Anaeramoeba flamelloides TaxID=1746091 RepID=A0AAV7ZJ70_9EUKA|nr:UBIQUITIN-60S ribosomal protein L40 [Anaeramoeba flamelloides]